MNDADYRAAQLLTVGFCDRELSDTLRRLLDRGVFGVVLFARNIGEAEEVAKLIASIKEYAGRPLLVGMDQEGGVVQRLRRGFTRIPPMRALGAIGDVSAATAMGRLLGRELRAVGVDWNYAPVLDVDTNPENPIIGNRSFGRDAELVAALGVALGKGLESEGVAACGKHFPGHGDTAQDSHQELPRLQHARQRLDEVELVPFRAWRDAGLASVMTAHVVFEPLDPAYPATMSRKVLQGILRDQLGYDGLVVTDDLEMKAIADNYGYEEAVRLGLEAGVDNFLCCHTAAIAHRLIESVSRGVRSGTVDEARLHEANERARRFAARWARPAESARLDILGSKEHLELVESIARRAGEAMACPGMDPTEIMEKIRLESAR